MPSFRPQVTQALEQALHATRDHARRVAVFDFDNTLIFNDIGELFSYVIIEEMAYRYDLDAFWDLIDEQDGRDEIRGLVEQLNALPPASRKSSDAYQRYCGEMGATYSRKLEREGKRSCYAWAVLLHVGLTEQQMFDLSEQAIVHELNRPIEPQTLRTSRGEEIGVTRGVRMLAPMQRLIQRLGDEGVEVWICSASNYWTIAQFAPRYGVPTDRIIANRVEIEDGVLTDRLVEPAMFMEGKAAAIMRDIGIPPTFVFGDSETDLHMLRAATGLATVIDTGHAAALVDEAREKGWAVQPQAELLGDAT